MSQLRLWQKPHRKSDRPAAPSHWHSFEALIELPNPYVIVRKMGAEVRFVGPGRTVARKGPVDFWGVVAARSGYHAGQAIVFDAKSSSEPRRLSLADDHFARHQRQELETLGRQDAIAGLLCESVHLRKVFWLPWNRIPHAPSIAWDDDRFIEVCLMDMPIDWKRILESSTSLHSASEETTKW